MLNREITIEFQEAEYKFTPSNKLLRKIDADLHPQTLFGVLSQFDGKQAPLPAIACIVSHLLNAGGGDFTEDDVLQELYIDTRDNNGAGVIPLVEAIGACLSIPDGDTAGNSLPPAKGVATKGKKKERQTSPDK